MFRTMTIAIVLGVSLSAASSAYANDRAAMIERLTAAMESSIESDCKDEAALKCMGVTESVCLEAKSDVLHTCTLPLLKKMMSGGGTELSEAESDMAQCAYNVAVDKHDIDPAKYERCVAANSNDQSDAIMKLLRGR